MTFAYTVGRDRTDVYPSLRAGDSFDELQDAVLAARHDHDKSSAPYFARPFAANGEGKPRRAKDNALPCAWLTLDVDRLDPEAAPRLEAALARWRGFWYSTATASADNRKRRVVLACSRVVTLDEYPRVVAAVEHELARVVGAGVEFDHRAAADVARLWYLPTEAAEAGAYHGAPLDVVAALAYQHRDDAPHQHEYQPAGERIAAGGRNAALTREAGRLRRLGLSPAAIGAALAVVNQERCDPPLEQREVQAIADSVGRYEAPASGGELPAPLGTVYTAGALLALPAQPTHWLIDGWLAEGASFLLGAHGGIGKSLLALQLAACLASGTAFVGLPVLRRRVLFFSAEDRAAVLRWRLRGIGQALGIDDAALGDRLVLVDQSRRPAELLGRDRYGTLGYTALFEELAALVRQHDAQVLLLDSASDAFGGNEIARTEVRRYITETQTLVPEDGAVGHLVHVDKAFARGGTTAQAYSGSTAWHNSVRQRWELALPAAEADDGTRAAPDPADPRRVLRLAKNNYGTAGAELALTLDAALGCFTRDYDAKAVTGDPAAERRDVLRALVASTDAGVPVPAAMQGPRTAYLVLSQQNEFPESLRGGAKPKTRRFAWHIEALRQIRHVTEGSYRRSNRHIVATLEPTSEGRAECVAFE